MSSKKIKLLESAQKNFLKGQYDRAVSEYRQLIVIDPSDLRHRQRIAEILTKANQKDEAVKEYTFLAKHYVDSVHYLKAIAVYKQIQKLEPVNPETSLILASLNEKQGLIGNATAEYASAVQIYEKNGENLKALKALESMLLLDSGNSAVKLRLAEKYFTTGSEEKSLDTFSSLLRELQERSDENGFNLIADRAVNLFGEKAKAVLSRFFDNDSPEEPKTQAPSQPQPENLTQLQTTSISEADSSEISPDPIFAADCSLEETDSEIYEDIDYIDDILPLDDDDSSEIPGISETDDEWEEDIELHSFDIGLASEAERNPDTEVMEELETVNELEELELEIDDELILESDNLPNLPYLQSDETFDLGKDLSMFADEINFDLFEQNSDITFDSADSGFKKGDLDREDAESHYSLGLAYKEMGLFDEAIGEFLVASRSSERRMDSLILQGVCLRETGSVAKAVEILSAALKEENISEDEYLGIQYELALCHEASGEFAKSRIILTDIFAARPQFSDVATRLKNLPS